jgi:hypothetical protein
MPLPVTLRALQYRNFRLFFAGQLISLIGTWMQNVAQAWLVYRLTGSAVLLALALAALTLSGRVRIWHIFVLAALLGVVNSFDIPARQAFAVWLRDDDQMGSSNTLIQSMSPDQLRGRVMSVYSTMAATVFWMWWPQIRVHARKLYNTRETCPKSRGPEGVSNCTAGTPWPARGMGPPSWRSRSAAASAF